MRRAHIACLLLALVVADIGSAAAQADATQRACDAQAASGVDARRLAALARGFNLTGWLDGPTVRRPDLTVLVRLRERGFTHVRLPIMGEHVMEAFSSREHVAQHLAELDRAIDTLIGLGFAVSLDMHPGDRFGRLHVAEPDKGLALLTALWRTLGQRYADRRRSRKAVFSKFPVKFPVLRELASHHDGTTAVASISSSASGSTSRFTSTSAMAGKWSPMTAR